MPVFSAVGFKSIDGGPRASPRGVEIRLGDPRRGVPKELLHGIEVAARRVEDVGREGCAESYAVCDDEYRRIGCQT